MIRLLLTSGRGPAECRIALARTLEALARDAETAGVELMSCCHPAANALLPRASSGTYVCFLCPR